MASSIICVSHLTKSYGGRKMVNDLSFEVGKGEIFALLGHNATGRVTSEGFVVLKGALVKESISVKSLSLGMIKLREGIFNEGKVVDLVTTEDILFSSSSAAGSFLLGYNANGPRTWKTKDGCSLKEIEESSTAG